MHHITARPPLFYTMDSLDQLIVNVSLSDSEAGNFFTVLQRRVHGVAVVLLLVPVVVVSGFVFDFVPGVIEVVSTGQHVTKRVAAVAVGFFNMLRVQMRALTIALFQSDLHAVYYAREQSVEILYRAYFESRDELVSFFSRSGFNIQNLQDRGALIYDSIDELIDTITLCELDDEEYPIYNAMWRETSCTQLQLALRDFLNRTYGEVETTLIENSEQIDEAADAEESSSESSGVYVGSDQEGDQGDDSDSDSSAPTIQEIREIYHAAALALAIRWRLEEAENAFHAQLPPQLSPERKQMTYIFTEALVEARHLLCQQYQYAPEEIESMGGDAYQAMTQIALYLLLKSATYAHELLSISRKERKVIFSQERSMGSFYEIGRSIVDALASLPDEHERNLEAFLACKADLQLMPESVQSIAKNIVALTTKEIGQFVLNTADASFIDPAVIQRAFFGEELGKQDLALVDEV